MKAPLTNIHVHVFNAECAPENFLRIMAIKFIRKYPGLVKSILENPNIRKVIWWINTWIARNKSKRRSNFAKYIAFLNVGTQNTQSDVFNLAFDVARNYDPSARIVALTLDMDRMDNQGRKPEKPLNTQLEEVKQLKRYHPDNFFPFLGVDPRSHSGTQLVNWVRPFFTTGIKSPVTGKVYPYFSGIKIYPALGYFPFDPRLDELYAYAQKEEIPVVAHCTRGGSQYIGSQIEFFIPRIPEMILPDAHHPLFSDAAEAGEEINKRIEQYYKKGWIKNNTTGDNDRACDLFSHPQNYIPVLIKYPKLKLCLAHMGGTDEIIGQWDVMQKEIHDVDPYIFTDLIFDLMVKYPNLYTDISYTLSGLEIGTVWNKLNNWMNRADSQGNKLENRVLFGTDFFMTEQEEQEKELYEIARKILGDKFDLLARDNAVNYLGF